MIKYYEEFHTKRPNVVVLFKDGNKYLTYKETAEKVKKHIGNKVKYDGFQAEIESSDISLCISKFVRIGVKVALCEKK